MSSPSLSPQSTFDQDQEVWENLKQAIASCSGFRRWQEEQTAELSVSQVNLEHQVRSYLRETLETLAY
jgi:hypothetical protein